MKERSKLSDNFQLPFLLRPENIVRYEAGDVIVLDRRRYPFEMAFVRCRRYEEVARAIEDMVTTFITLGEGRGLEVMGQTVGTAPARRCFVFGPLLSTHTTKAALMMSPMK